MLYYILKSYIIEFVTHTIVVRDGKANNLVSVGADETISQ